MAPRIVRIELKVERDKDTKQLIIDHSFEDSAQEADFAVRDRKRFLDVVQPHEDAAKANKKKRDGGLPLQAGDRVSADDFVKEPDDIHSGIHLRFLEKPGGGPKAMDEIVWFTKQENINFLLDVGKDAALILLLAPLPPKPGGSLTMDDVLSRTHPDNNPFENRFPAICAKGVDVHSGPLKDTPEVRDQQFYKWHARVLGTDILLDPHIEGHDD